jgi:hypothetical protein
MTTVIGTYNPVTKTVPVSFTYEGRSYKRNVQAILNSDQSYNAAATQAYVNQIVSGPAFSSDLQSLQATVPGGSLVGGGWVKLPSVYRIITNGTGVVTINGKNRSGTITNAITTFTAIGTENYEYYYFDPSIAYIQATFSGSATAEVV